MFTFMKKKPRYKKKSNIYLLRKLLGKRFFLHTTTLTILVLLVINTSVVYIIRSKLLAQSCMTVSQVSSDQRCLYIYKERVYEKGTRSEPHEGNPCGTDISSVIPATHLAEVTFYLDPNLIGPVCLAPPPTPTPPPATPTPPPASTPTPPPTAQPSKQPSQAPTPQPSVPATSKPPSAKPKASTTPPVITPSAAPVVTPTPPPPQSKLGGITRLGIGELPPVPVVTPTPTPTPKPSGIEGIALDLEEKIKNVSKNIDTKKLFNVVLSYLSVSLMTRILGYIGLVSLLLTITVFVVGLTPVRDYFERWFYERK